MTGGNRAEPERLEAFERRQFIMTRRIAGDTFRAIAIAAAERYGTERLPQGWDARYAHKDLTRFLKGFVESTREDLEFLRRIELERLDALWRVQFQLAVDGDGPAVDRCLRVMDRRATLVGLDKPMLYSAAEFESLATDVVRVIEAEVPDVEQRNRVFRALGFLDD